MGRDDWDPQMRQSRETARRMLAYRRMHERMDYKEAHPSWLARLLTRLGLDR